MQPTTDAIQREMDSIRSMRRISSQSGPGSLTLDPDLPPQSSPGGPSTSPSSNTRQSPTSPYANLPGIAALSLPGTTASGELIPPSIGEDDTIVPSNGEFFWVPASLHPELAPSEFKAFLRDHRRDVEESSDDSPAALGRVGSIGLQRSSSGLSRSGSGLGRKKSMLSRQYKPGQDGDDADAPVKPMKRNRSVYANAAPQLTIKDLQKLDDLADAAAAGNGGEASLIRSQLRRSISLGFMGSIVDHIDGLKEEEEEDSPVIVPAKALQRTARTRIRKPGLEGDGGGHRFANTRRGKRTNTMDSSMPVPTGFGSFEDISGRPTSDVTTSDHASLSDQEGEPYARPQAPSPEYQYSEGDRARPRFANEEEERPVSMGESIYDAYGGGDHDRDSVYYDARESGSFDKKERITSGDSFEMVTRPGAGARNGVVYEMTEDDEQFFAGASGAAAAASNASAPTVILRQHSPEQQAPEQLPLTQQPNISQRAAPPSKIDMPPSPYTQPTPQQQTYPSVVSTPSSTPSFIKEYGYQQQYSQPLPPSQMYQQQQQQQYAGGGGVVHQPAPKRHLDVPLTGQPGVSPPSSPELIRTPSTSPSAEVPLGRPFSAPPTTTGRPSSAEKRGDKEKEKGKAWGLFGRGGKDKEKKEEKEKKEKDTLKKNKKEKEKPETKVTPKEEEKASGGGIFGLFGGKKKHDGDSAPSHQAPHNQANAAAKSVNAKNQLLPFATASPVLAGQYARYPLHVERAVYRLSHIKLANPRRPLYEQVLISNLMFWYLGIINKPATPTTPPNEQNKLPANGGEAGQGNGAGGAAQPMVNGNGQPLMSTAMSPAQQAAIAQQAAAEKARLEQERLEKEQQEAAERERQVQEEQERRERELKEREQLLEKERSERPAKKTGLTKADREGRTRKAETPVRSPNYNVQSRTMEEEYSWDQDQRGGGGSGGRPSTSPPSSSSRSGQSSQHTAYHLPVRVQQRTMSGGGGGGGGGPQQPYFQQQDMSQVVYQPVNPYALPPGAKPPAPVENTWAVTSNAAASTVANDSKHRRSPPPQSQPYYDYNNPAPPSSNNGSNERPRPTRSPPPHDYLASGMPNGARPARSLSNSNNHLPVPAASGPFPPNPASSSPRVEYEKPAHTYSQSASAVVGVSQTNGVPPQAAPASGSGRLQKKKSTGNANNVPAESTKPPARRRKSVEAGGGDRRGVVEPDISFENMWQQQYPAGGYPQQMGFNGNQQQAQMQGQQGYYR